MGVFYDASTILRRCFVVRLLVSERSKLGIDRSKLRRLRLLRVVERLQILLLILVERRRFLLAGAFQIFNELVVLPSGMGRELAKDTEVAAGLDADNFEGLGDDHSLLSVVRRRNSLEHLEASKGELSAARFVRNHSSNNTEEHLGGRTLVERSLLRVGAETLLEESHPLDLVSVEGATDVDLLSTHDDDVLSLKNLLRDDGRESSHEVTSSVNDGISVRHSEERVRM